MKKLIDKINSKNKEARNSLNKTCGEENLISVYVESEDDIPFWKNILDKFDLKTKIHPASRTSLNRGKLEVLKQKDNVGKYLLLCVDSDYDYLLQGSTEISKLINENPYIFQTYAYSIENYKCYAKSLNSVVVNATCVDNNQVFDYEKFMSCFSKIIYDLFVYSFHDKKNEIGNFTIDNFSETIKLLEFVDVHTQGKEVFLKLKKSVIEKTSSLEILPETEINQYKEELRKLGVTSENAYLFVKGHTIYENVVCMFLKPIYTFLKKENLNQIREFSKKDEKSKKVASDRRGQYIKLVAEDIERELCRNTNYYNCFLMKKVFRDIENYKNQFWKN